MTRRFGSILLAGAVFAVFAVAQAPKVDPPAAESKPGDNLKLQEQNARFFKELTRRLLELAVKLDKSERPEDKERAKTIRAALEVAEKEGADNQFRKLVEGMSRGTNQIQDVEKLIGQDEELTKTLLEMITILMTDDETARLKAEIAMLEKFLKEAQAIKQRQETLRAITESKKGDPSKIAKDQKDVTDLTKDLGQRMGGNKSGNQGPKPESKSDPKASDPKDGDKASEQKDDTQGAKSESKDGDAKASGDGKPSKEGGPKASGEAKPGEPKDAEAKPTPKDDKDNKTEQSQPKSKGEGKGEAKESKGQGGEGKGKGGQPKDSPPSDSKGGGQSGSGGESPPQPPKPQNNTPGRKSIEEAVPPQKGAEEDVNKDKREDAGKKMDTAIEKIADAIEAMKKRLKQLREEELLKLLANLEARCSRMLAMQIEVYQNTKAIDAAIIKNGNVKTNSDIQKAQQQGDKEKDIIAEAQKTLKLLETEGSAVAFARVLEEVMGDMQAVQNRLDKAVVDSDTQAIEEQIIAMLKNMIEALKKQQQEMQNNKNNPNNSNNKPNQQLINQLAELKLIRALQQQVNSRTTMYGKKSEGEQAADPLLQAELKQLAVRQVRLQDMINKIATGANQ